MILHLGEIYITPRLLKVIGIGRYYCVYQEEPVAFML